MRPIDVVAPNAKPGTQIWFRGKRIIDAVIQTLAAEHGLSDATVVLETGASAGGLAAYLHADYVHQKLREVAPGLATYASAPISGFFLDHPNVLGAPVYEVMMRHLYGISNASSGVNPRCIAAHAPAEQWVCLFAANSYAHTDVPIFALNSAIDAWQTGCIYTATLDPGFPSSHHEGLEHANCGNVGHAAGNPKTGPWTKCSGDLEECNATQIGVMNRYIDDFRAAMNTTATFRKPGNGAFIHSCHTHCEAQTTPSWLHFKVGGVSIQESVSKWWRENLASNFTTPATGNTYAPCSYRTSTPHECNPTCHT